MQKRRPQIDSDLRRFVTHSFTQSPWRWWRLRSRQVRSMSLSSGGIARQPLDGEPGPLGECGAGELAGVDGAVVEDEDDGLGFGLRSEEHTSELQSLMRSSYAVFCLKNKTQRRTE